MTRRTLRPISLTLMIGVFPPAWPHSVEAQLSPGTEALQRAPLAALDTFRVAPPTGEKNSDRTNVQAAFDAVQPGGTVLFAPGTYLLGEGARLTVPDVTVLGHPDGTILRGCDPDAFAVEYSQVASVVFGCTGLYVQAERQTIRGLTFEYTWHGIVVGPYPTTEEEGAALQASGELPAAYPAGGQRIEGNTFRATPNGLRVLGPGEELSVVRDNDFIDVFHAIGIYGAPLHFLDNRVTVTDPEGVPFSRHPGSAVIVSPGQTDCAGHIVAGNRIEGYPDPIYVLVRRGEMCRGVEIRDNTIHAARVKVPEAWGGYTPTDGDSTMVGAPITLMNRTEPTPGVPEADTEGVLEDILVEGNDIVGAEGLGILVQGVSRSRIAGNTIAEVQRRTPFPGITWDGFDPRWEAANGSAIWLSPGSNGNEIAGNTFEDIAGSPILLEGDSNVVVLRRPDDVVRDLGNGNEVIGRTDETQQTTPPADPAGLGVGRQPALADTISDLAVESMALWNRLDPDAWLALFGDSVRWYYGATSLDRAGVEDMVRGLMSFTREADYRVLSEPDVEVLGPDAAVASFAMVQSATGVNGEELNEPTGLTFVYERLEDDWKIVRVHESMGIPPDSVVAETILSRTRELASAWERLDADAYLAHFSEDLTFYFEGSRLSRTEFETVVRQAIGSLRESTFEVLNPEVEVLGPNAAVISFELREVMADASGASTDLRGVLTLVFERRLGQWLVVRAHESLRPPDGP